MNPTDSGPAKSPPTLNAQGMKDLAPRQFAPEDLLAVEREALQGPFDKIEWDLRDEQGTHRGGDLGEILTQVRWKTVIHVEMVAIRPFNEVPVRRLNYLLVKVSRFAPINAFWSCPPQWRREVEFTFHKIVDLLAALPRRRFSGPVFVTEHQSPGRRWWDLRRAPLSMFDWVLIGIIGGMAVAILSLIAALIVR